MTQILVTAYALVIVLLPFLVESAKTKYRCTDDSDCPTNTYYRHPLVWQCLDGFCHRYALCSLIWVILFLCLLSFSTKVLTRNIPIVSEHYADEMGLNKRVLGQENRRPKCRRGRMAYVVSRIKKDKPRCHHYL
ncbi:hypothetical protein P8452_36263 [Trifolium repens]|nr:hypothetical protein P8452_36263 [Trifolium repens]